MNKLAIALLASSILTSLPTKAESPLQADINADYPHLEKLFKHLHSNPELSFQETETSKRLAAELKALGYSVSTGVGKTGVVAVMKNGKGPTVLIRADMDALPLQEKSGLAYASTKTQVNLDGVEMPVMHACGHDMHVTALVGTAKQMATRKDQWQGTLVLIGQPAEEAYGGAQAMLDDGLYSKFPTPDYALALHVGSADVAGKIYYRAGTMYSSADSVEIIVPGIGTHGAAPQYGKDPIVIGAQIVTALQTLITRDISPLEAGIVTVGTFHAGTAGNIIPDQATMALTVRANSDEVRETLLTGIERIAKNMGRAAGLPEDKLPYMVHKGGYEVTKNDASLTTRLDSTFKEKFGADRIVAYEQHNMAAEDFTDFTRTPENVPGFYFMVGGTPAEAFEAAKNGGPAIPGHHSPVFKIAPEPSIKTGVEAMTIAALELLEK
ncbi:amidohydrolase [Kordiimonas pumila]|uniref:Amidohydrolase n=1 Tax=Kordiimonas pumila TaxID=2161677 RepID=A0ABV7D6M8_9PROT|nr:amidohydrolase [Kordiimonas pumila]